MTKLTALLSVLAMSATAQAANTLDYDFRGDWTSLDYNDAATETTSAEDNTRFFLRTGRLQYKGNLNERFSYVGRLAFNKPAVDTGTSNSKRDALNAAVEYAYVTDKMSDMFSLTLGKFYTEIGGIEGNTSGADLYSVSPNYSHVGALPAALPGSNLGVNESGPKNILYAAGAKGTLTFAETQNIYLVVTNNVVADPVDSNAAFNQNRGMMGLAWKGFFMEKALMGLLSYHEASPQSATGHKDNKHTFMSAGIKYDSTWVGSLEYNTTDYKDGASGDKDTMYSAILKLGYKMEQWTPRLEFIMSEVKEGIASEDATKIATYGAILEYKPTAENVRYHLAVASTTQQPETGDDLTRMDITAGVRLFGDFLK
ncbi:porin [Bdellovibrio sp. HCB337]|uniref:porin n=1 Tax=Bdellovibrio sp. HCB337 TaxID=3394358 RepID=UPI0039A5CE4F